MKRALTGLAIVALLGAGYWFFIRDRGEAKPAGDEVQTAQTKKPKKKPKGPDKADRGDRQDRNEIDVLFDDDPEGALRLEGVVVREGDVGRPVAGALVTLSSNPPRIARSEDDGSFAFDKLVGRNYRLVARHPDGTAGPVNAKLSGTTEPVILSLSAAGELSVTVVDAKSNEPLANASVELRGIDRQTESTNGKGIAEFKPVVPTRYQVVAEAPGYSKQHARVRVTASGTKAEVRLGLRTGAAVRGVVLDADGKPLAGARVVYSGASDWSQRASPRWDAEVSGADGSFEFSAIPAGSFRFVARAPSRAPGRSELLTLDGLTAVDDVRIQLEKGAVISGVVRSTGGEAVAAARVRVTAEGGGFRAPVREAYADDNGAYEVDGLERLEVNVIAIGEDASSEIVKADLTVAPYERKVDLELAVDGVIAGIVVDTEGEPIEGAQVSATPDFRKGRVGRRSFRLRGFPRQQTDAGGRFRLTGLTEGDYSVRATRSSVGRRRGWLIEPVEAKTGNTDLRIELEADGGLIGKVTFANGDVPAAFSVSVGEWGGGTPFASKDGSFELPGLAPQEYTITVKGPGFDSKVLRQVVVKAGEPTDLGTVNVRKGRVLVGKVVDPSGSPVTGALVRAGRQIFGSGSSAKSGGRGGPPLARNTKEGTTDDTGTFSIYGLPATDVSIVAEHEELGRSVAKLISNGGQSVSDLKIQLLPFGALEGLVTQNGKPVGSVRVGASSLESPDVTYGVASGEDGTFRLDRLAPGDYKISGLVGTSPMAGFSFYSTVATVESGKTASVKLEIISGDVELKVSVKASEGTQPSFTWVTAVRGKVSPKTARELELQVARSKDGFSGQSFSFGGMPATIRNLLAGDYMLCGTPYPVELTGMADSMAYMAREGDNLAVYCSEITVPDSPKSQETTVEVVVPEFVPEPPSEG